MPAWGGMEEGAMSEQLPFLVTNNHAKLTKGMTPRNDPVLTPPKTPAAVDPGGIECSPKPLAARTVTVPGSVLLSLPPAHPHQPGSSSMGEE